MFYNEINLDVFLQRVDTIRRAFRQQLSDAVTQIHSYYNVSLPTYLMYVKCLLINSCYIVVIVVELTSIHYERTLAIVSCSPSTQHTVYLLYLQSAKVLAMSCGLLPNVRMGRCCVTCVEGTDYTI